MCSYLYHVFGLTSVTVSESNFPATTDIPAAIDTVCAVVDGVREGTFRIVGRIGFFAVGLASDWIADMAGEVVVVGSVGGCIHLLEVRGFGDHGDILWRQGNLETFNSIVLVTPAVHSFDEGVDFLQRFW